MTYSEEIKNKRIGWTVTIMVHALLLLFLLLYKAWPFDPPVESLYGVQINFGTSDFGSGDIQAPEPPSTSEIAPIEEEPTEEAFQEPTEPNEAADITEEVETSEGESNVIATQEQTETTAELESENQETTESTESSENQEASSVSENNNGNDKDRMGDKGKPNGEINDSDIYKGASNGGGGNGANITGWHADGKPNEYTKSNETGKVVFKIQIDEDGEVEYVKVVEKTLSPEVVLFYKRQIERITFTAKADNPNPAEHSVGTYTIIVNSK